MSERVAASNPSRTVARALFRLSLLVVLLLATACCKGRGRLGGGAGSGPPPLPSGAVLVPPSPNPPSQGAHGAADEPKNQVVLPSGATAPISFASLVKASDPAIVTINAFVEERGRTGRRRVVSEGLGTGFIYDPTGYILTNNHVVAEATDLIVRLADERRVPAKLIGRDPPTDVAVLKIDVPGLQALRLGDSDAIDVGDWVIAIGNPYGLSHTVSAGIISAKGRTRAAIQDLGNRQSYFNFLQTDAAINPGNSGGPLLNMKGEVVGINTAVRANANNLGFAIPINMAKSLVPMLVKEGKVRRSALGVTVGPLTEEDIARLKRTDKKGALIRGVQPGGAADKAGLAPDDVIVAFDGKSVNDPEELRWMASIAGVGSTATVRVARGDRVFDVKVTLGALPEEPPDEAPTPMVPPGFP